MRTLYLEAASGISGDMTVAALLDLGAKEQALREGLQSLQVPGFTLEIGRVRKAGLDACSFTVHLEHPEAPKDAVHEEMAGHSHDHGHSHEHAHPHGHPHGHEHPHGHSHHDGARNLAEVLAIIDGGKLTPNAAALAKKMFGIVAEAEAKAHGLPVDQVHFHEVGAVDSIVDLVGAAICLDNLHPDRVVCSPLTEGCGTVHCAHGELPVPVPAVAQIAQAYRVPLQRTDFAGELVTPTGIAIAAAAADAFEIPRTMRIAASGMGAGKKDRPGHANVLRAYLLEEEEHPLQDEVVLLETNIDDQTGESLGFLQERLLQAGALDCWFTPIFMKKNRPAQQLSVLCRPEQEPAMIALLFAHSSSIGLRRRVTQRVVMEREMQVVETTFGPIPVKVCRYGEIVKPDVEFSAAREAACKNHVTVEQVFCETLMKFWHG